MMLYEGLSVIHLKYIGDINDVLQLSSGDEYKAKQKKKKVTKFTKTSQTNIFTAH